MNIRTMHPGDERYDAGRDLYELFLTFSAKFLEAGHDTDIVFSSALLAILHLGLTAGLTREQIFEMLPKYLSIAEVNREMLSAASDGTLVKKGDA